MDPNELKELQTNTSLNPDFGMNDEGFIMHVQDIDDFFTEEMKQESMNIGLL